MRLRNRLRGCAGAENYLEIIRENCTTPVTLRLLSHLLSRKRKEACSYVARRKNNFVVELFTNRVDCRKDECRNSYNSYQTLKT